MLCGDMHNAFILLYEASKMSYFFFINYKQKNIINGSMQPCTIKGQIFKNSMDYITN